MLLIFLSNLPHFPVDLRYVVPYLCLLGAFSKRQTLRYSILIREKICQ